MTSARRLVWWPESALSGLAAKVTVAWNDWCLDWGLVPGPVAACNACDAGDPSATPAWCVLDGTGGAPVWLGLSKSPEEAVLAWLFGAVPMPVRHGRSLARETAAKALCKLHEAMTLALVSGGHAEAARGCDGDARPPSRETRPWSGAVRLAMGSTNAMDEVLVVHLSPDHAARLMARPGPACSASIGNRTPVDEAAATLPVPLRVHLADIVLDLGTLQTLRLGDVVRVDHALADPVRVQLAPPLAGGPSAQALCIGWLGAREGRRAIRLSRSPVST